MNTETVTAQTLPVGATIITEEGVRRVVRSNRRHFNGDFRIIGFTDNDTFSFRFPVLHNFTVANFTEPELF